MRERAMGCELTMRKRVMGCEFTIGKSDEVRVDH